MPRRKAKGSKGRSQSGGATGSTAGSGTSAPTTTSSGGDRRDGEGGQKKLSKQEKKKANAVKRAVRAGDRVEGPSDRASFIRSAELVGFDGAGRAVNSNIRMSRDHLMKQNLLDKRKWRWEEDLSKIRVTRLSDSRALHECEKAATDLLGDIESTLQRLGFWAYRKKPRFPGEGQPTTVVRQHYDAYLLRAMFRLAQGNDQGAADDATEGLIMVRFALGNEVYSSMEYICSSMEYINLLNTRGQALCNLGDLDGAFEDLKACCSAARVYVREEICEPLPSVAGHYEAKGHYLSVVALRRTNDASSSRPHFAREEREKIDRQLEIGCYAKQNYRCLACKAEPSDTVSLSRCGRCQNVWLCSKECLQVAWRHGHKESCSKTRSLEPFRIPGHDKCCTSDIEAQIKTKTYGILFNYDRPFVIMLDSATGRYFEIFTDNDVEFVA